MGRFVSGNQAAVKNGQCYDAAVLEVLQRANPPATWQECYGESIAFTRSGIGPCRQRARRHAGDCAYSWFCREVARALGQSRGSFVDANVQMGVLRAVRRLAASGAVHVTYYAVGKIGSIRLLDISPTNGEGTTA